MKKRVFFLITFAIVYFSFGHYNGVNAAPPQLLLQKSSSVFIKGDPVLGDNGVLYAVGNFDQNSGTGEGVVAIEPQTGTLLWGPISSSECAKLQREISIGENGSIFVVGDWNSCGDGKLVAIDSEEGTIKWSHGTRNLGYSPHPRQPPAIDDTLSSVYFGSSYLFSVNTNTGTDYWRKSGGYYIGEKGIAIDSLGNVYYGSHNGSGHDSLIRSFSSSGSLRFSMVFTNTGVGIGAILFNNILILKDSTNNITIAKNSSGHDIWSFNEVLANFVDDKEGNIYANTIGNEVVSLHQDGTIRWRVSFTDVSSTKVDFIDKHGILYIRGDNRLLALKSLDGSLLWSFAAKAAINTRVSLVSGGDLFIADISGNTYLLDVNTDYAESAWPVAVYGNRRHTGKSADVVPLPSPPNTPPIADAGPDQAVMQIGTTVQLDGTQSYDLEGDELTYDWTIVSKPDGSNASLSDLASLMPSFVADVHGDYVIYLVVSDGTASSEPDQVIVTFANADPVANAGTNKTAVQGEEVCFDGSDSEDVNGDFLTFTWTLTSSPVGSTASLEFATTMYPCITTDLAGNYEVSLIVNDGFVDSPLSTASVQVISYQDATTVTLQETVTTINNIPIEDLKNKNMQKTLTSKVNAALALTDQGAYAEALDKLQNDLLGKTDGCATYSSPDKNDWIEDCTSQGQVYPLIVEAIEYVTELSNESTNNQYFQMLLTKARVGDILLFSQCNGEVTEPLNCSAIIPEFLGYGYFSHAAIISEINADSLTYLHSYPGTGIKFVTVSSQDLVGYTSIMLLTVTEVDDATAIAIVDYGYSHWDGTEYDSDFLPFNSKMYCSELVYDIYNEFGVSLNDASYYPLGLITPDNLLQSGDTESVMAYSPIR